MAATRLSDSQKQELVARFCGGASLQQLATLFGCSPTTVSRTAKAAIDLAQYELLLKQQKAQRGGSLQADGPSLGELPLELAADVDGVSPGPEAPMGPGDAVGPGALTLSDPDDQPALGITVGSYDLEGPSDQASPGPSDEAGGGPVEGPAQDELVVQQGALDLPGSLDLAIEAPAVPSPVADAVAETPGSAAPQRILGRRRRSGAATPVTPPTPAFPATDLDGELPALRVLPDRPVAVAPAGPAPAVGPGVLAIDDADDFGADDAEDDLSDEDLSDDPNEEILFAQGETFVAIPVGPIIDDLAIHEAVPFSAAALPTSAFLLVDKTVELQARPLRELPELGRLAADELDRQALVVFVNPRQAKRQCGRTQRVIPLPDPSLLERTAPYLIAQGITRLVIEGALYALPGG